MRAIPDTSVLISAYVFPGGTPEAVFRLALEGRLAVVEPSETVRAIILADPADDRVLEAARAFDAGAIELQPYCGMPPRAGSPSATTRPPTRPASGYSSPCAKPTSGSPRLAAAASVRNR